MDGAGTWVTMIEAECALSTEAAGRCQRLPRLTASMRGERHPLLARVDRDRELLEEVATEQSVRLLQPGVVRDDAERSNPSIAHLDRRHLHDVALHGAGDSGDVRAGGVREGDAELRQRLR